MTKMVDHSPHSPSADERREQDDRHASSGHDLSLVCSAVGKAELP